jgi:putative DNA primase/helicase
MQWLRIDAGRPVIPPRSTPPAPKTFEPELDSDRWRPVWNAARPIARTAAENYLRSRGLHFEDPDGRVLRFTPRRVRRSLDDSAFEHHPALLAALCDARSGAQRGIQSIFLEPDGRDRLRDKKSKTTTGHFTSAAIMLSEFEEPTLGLYLCEGVETGIALFQEEHHPIWACGPAGNLRNFPVLSGIESLTIAHDTDLPGLDAAEALAQRWRDADREVLFLAPPAGKDWADRL